MPPSSSEKRAITWPPIVKPSPTPASSVVCVHSCASGSAAAAGVEVRIIGAAIAKA
jgi:hypothetical protein